MKSLLLGLGFWLVVLVLPAAAQVQKFPYEAGLTGEDVYVRSGPGKKYYPTGKLKSGDHVIVHRHDPGGWYMISPPAGRLRTSRCRSRPRFRPRSPRVRRLVRRRGPQRRRRDSSPAVRERR